MYAKTGLSPTAAFAGLALPVMASSSVVVTVAGLAAFFAVVRAAGLATCFAGGRAAALGAAFAARSPVAVPGDFFVVRAGMLVSLSSRAVWPSPSMRRRQRIRAAGGDVKHVHPSAPGGGQAR